MIDLVKSFELKLPSIHFLSNFYTKYEAFILFWLFASKYVTHKFLVIFQNKGCSMISSHTQVFWERYISFHNIEYYELQTFRQLILEFFGSFQIIRFVKILKIDLYLRGYFIMEAKTHSAKPIFFVFWGSQCAQFTKFRHGDYPRFHLALSQRKKSFFLVKQGRFAFNPCDVLNSKLLRHVIFLWQNI